MIQPAVTESPDLLSAIRIGGVFTGLVIIGLTWFAVRLLTGSLTRLGNRFTDKRLVLHQLATLGRFVLYLGGIVIAIVLSINLSKEAVLGLTGTAAVAIGLALKDLTASVLAGIVIIIDRPFQVGDRVSFGGAYGEITAIGLRSVRLTTLDDNVVTIPNNKFLTEQVSSGNWGALDMMIQMDFYIGLDQDVSLAKRLVEESLTSNRYAFLKKPWVVLVNEVLQDHMMAVRLRAKAYVLDVQYEKAFETDVTERVLMAFREHAVLPPAILHRSLDTALAPRGAAPTAPTRSTN
jgi:small-conductance mechanosensitive channel